MNKKVIDYIVDLEEKKLTKKGGVILIDNNRVKEMSLNESFYSSNEIYKFNIDDTIVYAKGFSVDTPLTMGTSRLFNECGIATPIITVIIPFGNDFCFSVSQDLKEIGKTLNLNAMTLGDWQNRNPQKRKDLLKNCKNLSKWEVSKWSFILDKDTQDVALSIMTKGALDNLNSTTLLQELVTYTDGHFNNYIAFCNPQNGKIQYLAPIDLEFNEMIYDTNPRARASKEFDKFLKRPYHTTTITNRHDDEKTYPERVKAIRNLLHAGKLSDNNIEAIKTALKYDLSGKLKELGNNARAIKKYFKSSVGMTQYLWEYNRNTIGRDLGM